MKRMKWLNCLLVILFVGMATSAFAGTKHEFDKKTYDKIAKRNIGRLISGNVDADTMMMDMEQLVELGIAGCKEHMSEAETPALEAKMMRITMDNAQRMSLLTLDQIEEQWHEGGVLRSNGIDINKFSHFDEVMSHFDAVVHPATVIICLKQYKKTKNVALLEQAQDELEEVREHLKHIE